MIDKMKDMLIIIVSILFITNIVIGVILISTGSKKSNVLSTGMSGLIGNVGLIDINGAIFLEEDNFSTDYVNANSIAEKIKTFADAPNIKAIRINITSPGGTVSAAETILSALDYAKSKNKKIVVFMKEIAASGGYYVSVPADYIIASRGTFTGSIGVIVQSLNLKGLLDKIGVKPYTFKSGEYKDILSPFREISESEKKLIQNIINTYYNRFIEVILKYRGEKISKDQLLKIADGRIITEEDATSYKLIDEVGDEFKVEETLKQLTGEKNISYVRLPEKRSLIKELLRSTANKLNILNSNSIRNSYPKVLYITY